VPGVHLHASTTRLGCGGEAHIGPALVAGGPPLECRGVHEVKRHLGGWGGVTTKPTAAEHMYSVAGQEERRKEKGRRRKTESHLGSARSAGGSQGLTLCNVLDLKPARSLWRESTGQEGRRTRSRTADVGVFRVFRAFTGA
jgi:hypothetical protein